MTYSIGCGKTCNALYKTFQVAPLEISILINHFIKNDDPAIAYTIENNQEIIINNYSFTKIIYVYKGYINIEIGDKKTSYEEGVFIFINAHTDVTIYPCEKHNIYFIYEFKRTFFDSQFMNMLSACELFYNFINYCLMNKEIKQAHLIFNCNNFIVRQKLFIIFELILGKELRFLHNSLLELFNYLEYSKNSTLAVEDSTNVNSDVVNDIIKFIKTNYNTVTLEKLSSAFNYHPNYISALIRKETGMTFLEHLHVIRLKQAKELLETTDYPIKEISTKLGYTDVSYLNRMFKKEFNCSPSSYRKKLYKNKNLD